MNVVGLYNNIYTVLTSNKELMELLEVGDSTDFLELAKKVQKRAKPPNLIENVPLIAFYTPTGGVDRGNSEVYRAPFAFNVYTNDDVNKAQLVATEITKIFHNENLPFCGLESFQSRLITSHESGVDVENIYCFTVVIEFSITFN